MSSGLEEDHEDKLIWSVFKYNEKAIKHQEGSSKLKTRSQLMERTTRLLPDGNEENEQMKTLGQSKQLLSMNSSGPSYVLKVQERPRSDEVPSSHSSVSKQLSNQSPASYLRKVSSGKKAGDSKHLTIKSPPLYQVLSLEDKHTWENFESYLQSGNSSDLLKSQQIQREKFKVAFQ